MPLDAVSTGYPFLDVFLTILIVFAWVIYIWIAVTILIDIFRRRDLSGWGKAAWVVVVVVLEWIGVLIYLIANHNGMAERQADRERAAQAQVDAYVRQAAGTGGPAAEIERAKALLDSGAISQAEFEQIKSRALAGSTQTGPAATDTPA
ncbi:MAG: SHOCT domain-containing protein [Solirubrobacterales bacterium]|nr:SHOCT domain-containing protein [Solirubrobacterales bacterium]MBV9716396.1 SHOCT domain-containing protein [Solirubrobacterales bacterium]